MIAVLLLISVLFVIVGLAGLFAWILDHRARRALSAFNAERIIAQARAEVSR